LWWWRTYNSFDACLDTSRFRNLLKDSNHVKRDTLWQWQTKTSTHDKHWPESKIAVLFQKTFSWYIYQAWSIKRRRWQQQCSTIFENIKKSLDWRRKLFLWWCCWCTVKQRIWRCEHVSWWWNSWRLVNKVWIRLWKRLLFATNLCVENKTKDSFLWRVGWRNAFRVSLTYRKKAFTNWFC
jgi:hypothetical protein